jgi:hypothetical protein
LARFTPHDFIALAEKHGIAYREEKRGQLFCDRGSQEIIRGLTEECRAAGARIRINCAATEVEKSDRFTVHTDHGTFQSQSLVVAAGGLSPPKIGAGGFGYGVARRFGLSVVPPRPGLVPLTWNRKDRETFGELAGVSLDAGVSCGGHEFLDRILFTHRGLSGPAILQISSYWDHGTPILVDLLPGKNLEDEVIGGGKGRAGLNALLKRRLPRRFAQKWISRMIPPQSIDRCSATEAKTILSQLHRWRIEPEETEGYATAEVTAGGVDTAECSSKTMESRKVASLFFIGEVLDVTGQLGGFNLQWAWSSGFAAGQHV